MWKLSKIFILEIFIILIQGGDKLKTKINYTRPKLINHGTISKDTLKVVGSQDGNGRKKQ